MSYCRWSSDNSQSDFYIYEDVYGGFTTHLAGRHRIGIPGDLVDPLTTISEVEPDEWLKQYKEYNEILDKCVIEDIDHPLAGESFNDNTLEELRERVVYLIGEGFYAPDWLLGVIDEEIEEQDNE